MPITVARLEKVARGAIARLQVEHARAVCALCLWARCACSRTDCARGQGHSTERILQNAIAAGLCASGVPCQQEIVLPVLQDDTFVGFNRLDIVAIDQDARAGRSVLIIELKTLSGLGKSARIPQRVLAQCAGYRQCARAFFGADTRVTVYLLNVSVDARGAREVRAFAVPAPPPAKPAPPAKAPLYTIKRLLRTRTRARSKQALVWWQGFPRAEASWEPVRNLPPAVRKLAAAM